MRNFVNINKNEIKCNVLGAADQKAQIEIEAQLNATTPEHIREILKEQGVDLRTLRSSPKKHIAESKKSTKKVTPKPEYSNVIVSAFAALHSRVKELGEQKKAIEDELAAIGIELNRIEDIIAGRGEKE